MKELLTDPIVITTCVLALGFLLLRDRWLSR